MFVLHFGRSPPDETILTGEHAHRLSRTKIERHKRTKQIEEHKCQWENVMCMKNVIRMNTNIGFVVLWRPLIQFIRGETEWKFASFFSFFFHSAKWYQSRNNAWTKCHHSRKRIKLRVVRLSCMFSHVLRTLWCLAVSSGACVCARLSTYIPSVCVCTNVLTDWTESKMVCKH